MGWPHGPVLKELQVLPGAKAESMGGSEWRSGMIRCTLQKDDSGCLWRHREGRTEGWREQGLLGSSGQQRVWTLGLEVGGAQALPSTWKGQPSRAVRESEVRKMWRNSRRDQGAVGKTRGNRESCQEGEAGPSPALFLGRKSKPKD